MTATNVYVESELLESRNQAIYVLPQRSLTLPVKDSQMLEIGHPSTLLLSPTK